MNENTTSQAQILRDAARDIMAVEDVTEGAPTIYSRILGRTEAESGGEGRAIRLRGRLLLSSEEAYERLAARFSLLGYTPLLRKDSDGPGELILAVPGELREATQRPQRAMNLFILTVLSCLFAGAQMMPDLAGINFNLLEGWPFALSLLSILGAHEFGHYLIARRLGTPVSLPYFIPMPLGPFGTLGAFINMTAPPRNRRHLLAIAVAGPLAGFVLAAPILWLGLHLSEITTLPNYEYMLEGNSLLYAGMKYLVFGHFLPAGGQDVFVHQVAFAGWAGLLVTGLNLIPAGQLDGGHIVYALVGEQYARIVLWVVLAGLAGLSLLWGGWLLWLVLVYFFGRMRVEPLDAITDLTGRQRLLGVVMIVLFILVFTPIPLQVITP